MDAVGKRHGKMGHGRADMGGTGMDGGRCRPLDGPASCRRLAGRKECDLFYTGAIAGGKIIVAC